MPTYNVTVEALGFDPIRVKYREQRRKAITNILRLCLIGDDINVCITQACEGINKVDQEPFQESVKEELSSLSEAAIAGLGVSREELNIWKEKVLNKQ